MHADGYANGMYIQFDANTDHTCLGKNVTWTNAAFARYSPWCPLRHGVDCSNFDSLDCCHSLVWIIATHLYLQNENIEPRIVRSTIHLEPKTCAHVS